MSRRDSYHAPLPRSKFMVDFWVGVYQFKQILVQLNRELEKDLLIPRLFSSLDRSNEVRAINGIDIFDVDTAVENLSKFEERIIADGISKLQSAAQLRHSLLSATKANIMTTRVTGYIKKKRFSFASSSSAQLTSDDKLVPDVTSLEYRVCHSVLWMISKEFEGVVNVLRQKVSDTLNHVVEILCVVLCELDTSLNIEDIKEAEIFLWSSPTFLTNWCAFVNSMLENESETSQGSTVDVNSTPKNGVFGKLKSRVKSISRSPSKGNDVKDDPRTVLINSILSLSPLHEACLALMKKIYSPSAPYNFDVLVKHMSLEKRPRTLTDCSESSTEDEKPKWYLGKFLGRKSPDDVPSSSGPGNYSEEIVDDFAESYAKSFGTSYISEEENGAVEIDHKMIHSLVLDSNSNCGEHNSGFVENHNVRLFSWYMLVVMHNARYTTEKIKEVESLHEQLERSEDKDTDRQCLQDTICVGNDITKSLVSTSQVVRSMRHLFSDDESDEDESTRPLANLCCYMTQVWLSTAQRVRVVVSQYMAMRREKISSMAKTAMPFCTEEEIEAFVEHDDGVHIHKLIAAVNRDHSEVVRLLEAKLKGPQSLIYIDIKHIRDQAKQVLEMLSSLNEQPVKYLKS